MDRKAQIGFGMIIMAAVAILIGLAFYSTTFSQSVGQMTKTSFANRSTITMPNAGSTSELAMCGQKVLTIVITNSTGGEVVPATNYTTSQSVGTDGYLASKLTSTNGLYVGNSVNISCTFEPKGYISDGAGRGVVGLIAIFMALLILTAAMPNLRDKALDIIKGN